MCGHCALGKLAQKTLIDTRVLSCYTFANGGIMEELLDFIKEQNVFKKLTGDYIFYSTSLEFWKEAGVESVADFEHWKAKQDFEQEFRSQGNRGFLPFDPDSKSTQELHEELAKLKG